MIGVKWADPTRSLSSDLSLRPSPSHSPKPLQQPSMLPPPKTSGGRSIQLAPSSSAFRRLDQQQAVVPKPVANAMQTVQQKTTGQQGVLGKLGEYVFGF